MADYNINAITRRVVFTGSAGVGPYAFSFEVLDQNDVAVYFNTTSLTLTTDYTVTVNANGTGSVTLVTGSGVPTTPTASDTVIIIGARDIERVTDFVTAGDLLASSLNEQLDALTIINQQLAEEGQRSMRAPVYDPALVADGGTLNMTLPPKADRVDTVMAFDTNGNPVKGPTVAGVATMVSLAADIATLADIEDGTVATDAISDTAAIAANVTTVAGIAPNVTTVAGNTANVNTVAGNTTNINTVAGNNANVTTVAGISGNVTTVAGISADVTAVAGDATDIGTVSANIANVNSVAAIDADVTTVAGMSSADITTVAGISANVTTAAGISANITTVAGIASDVTAAATNASDISAIAAEVAKVVTVANDLNEATSEIDTVANSIANVDLVGGSIANVNTVATNLTDINSFANTYFISATAPVSPTTGDLWFDTTASTMKVYDGAGFVNAGSSVNGTSARYSYTATAAQTTFSATYDAGYVDVYLNGVKLVAGTDFTATDGSTVVLATGAALNDTVDIVGYGTFSVSSAVTLPDNVKATFGTGSDMEIYHNPASSDVNRIDLDGNMLSIVQKGINGQLRLKNNYSATGNTHLDFYNQSNWFGSVGSNTDNSVRYSVYDSHGGHDFRTNSGNFAARIDSSGNVGIGITSPVSLLTVDKGNVTGAGQWASSAIAIANPTNIGAYSQISFGYTPSTTNASAYIGYLSTNQGANGYGDLVFGTRAVNTDTQPTERMRIDSGGNVGIGTSSPNDYTNYVTLTLNDTNGAEIDFEKAGTVNGSLFTPSGTNDFQVTAANASGNLIFSAGSYSEKMRLNSSGSVLVAKAASNFATAGIEIRPVGAIDVTRSSGSPLHLNRTSTDGDISTFYKDGITAGLIGTFDSGQNIFIGSGDTGVTFNPNVNGILPHNPTTNSQLDNAIDLGYSSFRFQDIYATNGTIQTSDANEKQQIAALTDAEMTAAKAISALFKTFKWNSAVEAKGDAARTHTGVIAQDVQAAMSAAGLNAANYAFWCSDTWWETQTEVPAVEAVEAVDAVYEDVVIPAVEEELDEEGNVIVEAQAERTEQRLVSEAVEAVEAVAAYTRTDTYYIAEEAPDGATERTRMGIRYPELLAFIGAATEQRLTTIEARITALENV